MNRVAIVVPNWNGADLIQECIDSLLVQSYKNITIVVVENGSSDSSLEVLSEYKDRITVLSQKINQGFAGGVNIGIKYALKHGAEYIALFNNDAKAKIDWVENLVFTADKNPGVGIITSKILIGESNKIDSTGDWYTTTGMPFPRGRNEIDKQQYDNQTVVFGASGGASLYKSDLFKDIGFFDEDFFAYYEDVDLSFRAQLRGWTVRYQPDAIVYHRLSATSSKLGYFAIKQSAKNFWLIYIKNVPFPLFIKYMPFVLYRYVRMYAARLIKGGFWAFSSGFFQSVLLLPKKLLQRRHIQKTRKVSNAYLESIIYKGKPPIPPTQ